MTAEAIDSKAELLEELKTMIGDGKVKGKPYICTINDNITIISIRYTRTKKNYTIAYFDRTKDENNRRSGKGYVGIRQALADTITTQSLKIIIDSLKKKKDFVKIDKQLSI